MCALLQLTLEISKAFIVELNIFIALLFYQIIIYSKLVFLNKSHTFNAKQNKYLLNYLPSQDWWVGGGQNIHDITVFELGTVS